MTFMMRKALISSLVCAACLFGCNLDTRPHTGSAGGTSVGACGDASVACDAGVSGNGGKAASSGNGGGKAESGRGGAGGSIVVGEAGMSGGDQAGSTPPPPPPPKLQDGASCSNDDDCVSSHCSNGLCCTNGDCCRAAADCPKTIVNGIQLVCNDPSQCQGSGGTVACRDNRCVAEGGDPNDSACTSVHQASDCGPYKPTFCNGMVDQQAPPCATSCGSDADCDANAHCDAFGACVLDMPDGSPCTADKECKTNHCSNNVCCAGGDCCSTNLTCAGYVTPASCTDLSHCSGTRKDGVCMSNQCRAVDVADGTACAGMVVAQCGLYADAVCGTRQVTPACATDCRVDSQCAAGAYCDATGGRAGQCQPKLRDGSTCTTAQQCQNTCNKGFCCADSDPNTQCCGVDADCAALGSTKECVNTTTCDSLVIRATCVENRCRTAMDSTPICHQQLACGPEYSVPSATCPLTCGCSRDTDCSPGFKCSSTTTRGRCIKDPNSGMAGMPAAGSPARAGAGAGAGGS
jgi:hypothetical protein